MSFSLRFAKPEDMPAVHALVKELALFERAPEEVLTSPEEISADAFGPRDYCKILVAEDENGSILGMALYYIAYSSWKGKILFLDDLIVSENSRGSGVGKAFMDKLFDYCRSEGIRQMRWQVLDWNENAIDFYEKIGAYIDKEWYTCKMSF